MAVKGNIVSGVMLLGLVLIWGMLVVQISAQPASETCYSKCMTKLCKLKCASEQISTAGITKAVVSNEDDTKNKYCVLGCAYSKCIDKSTPTDLRAEEVERCINSCDETCVKN
ncbi:hypothetical protein MKW98_020907 [Papaver atlanticum]|uniref:Thionin-like protein n=1 Tax=Papaver atlanticum TaxID=357466 RepID=A0AAD4XX77_9MAGN|nr:hypothetical protein MKW98_020907 [Papaver atlanticum]